MFAIKVYFHCNISRNELYTCLRKQVSLDICNRRQNQKLSLEGAPTTLANYVSPPVTMNFYLRPWPCSLTWSVSSWTNVQNIYVIDQLVQRSLSGQTRTLRSANQYLLQNPRVSTEFVKRSFSYLAPKIWNNIPLDIRLCSTLPTFKRHLKTYLFK